MTTFAVIPARGGSRGLPNKNILKLGGKPLLHWSMEAAEAAESIDRYVVSTDSTTTAHWAEAGMTAKGSLLWRPEELALDSTPLEPVIAHALAAQPEPPTCVVLLQPTSPLRTAQHINEALETLTKGDADCVLSVVRSHAFLWNGCSEPLNYDPAHRPNRQDFEQYEENGAIYAFTMTFWRRSHNRLGGRTALYVMPEETRIQIDSALDFKLVEAILCSRSVTEK